MKRYFMLIMCLCLAFTLVACGSDDTATDNAVSAPSPTEPAEEQPSPTLVPTPVPTEAPDVAEVTPPVLPVDVPEVDSQEPYQEIIEVAIYTESGQSYDDETGAVKSTYSYQYPVLAGYYASEYPALAQTFEGYRNHLEEGMKDTVVELNYGYEEMKASDPDSLQYYEFTSTGSMRVERADRNMVSLRESSYSYLGGVHGMYGDIGLCYDPVTGEELVLSDIVADKPAFAQEVLSELQNRYADELMYEDFSDDTLEEYITQRTEEDSLLWVAGYQGISVIFNPYEIASFAAGMLEVMIPYEGHEGMFTQRVTSEIDSYMIRLGSYVDMLYDLDGDHTPEEMVVFTQTNDEYGDFDGYTVGINGVNEKVECDGYSIDSTFIHTSSGDFLYIKTIGSSDDNRLDIIELKKSGPVLKDTIDGLAFANAEPIEEDDYSGGILTYNPGNIVFTSRVDMIGTNFVKAFYTIDDGGRPEVFGDVYEFVSHYCLSPNTDITFEARSIETGMPMGEVTVTAGSNMYMYYTDGKTYVDFLLEDGTCARLAFDGGDSAYYNGVFVGDMFDGVIYAD